MTTRTAPDRPDHRRPARPVRRARALGGTLVAGLALGLLLAPAAAATGTDDPDLDQTLDELAVVHGERVLETGHVDLGPKYEDDGTWRFLIHDDVAKADATATSVWRYPDETVLRVLDEAQLTVPDDDAYSFIGADPGATVYVVPQTQDPDVVWVGWNTQDPEVMSSIDRGITLSLTGVQGPGTLTVYLQSGSFGDPQVLWDSADTAAQPAWVDVNTHTHANWVFTEPGVYLVRLTAEADLIDGSHVSDTQVLRFAVGTATSTDEALAAAWQGATDPAATASAAAEGSGASEGTTDGATGATTATADPDGTGSDPLVPVLVAAIVVVAVGLVAGFTVAGVRGRRARRRVLGLDGRGGDGPEARP